MIDQNEFFDKRIASKDVSGYYLIKNGEFAYNKSTSVDAPWGAIKRLDRYEMGVLSTLYIVFRIRDSIKTNSDYIVTYYDTNIWHKEVKAIAAEGARNHGLLNITPSDFFETVITLPKDFEEQQKIGEYFSNLDNLITLHQRKLFEAKNNPKNGSKNFFRKIYQKLYKFDFNFKTYDWEQRKLLNVTESIKNGYTYKADGNREHKYKVTRIESISSGIINVEKLGSSDDINKDYKLIDGDILFSHINSLSHIGNTAMYTADLGEIYHGMNLINIRAKQNIVNSRFLLYLLKKKNPAEIGLE